MPRRKREDRQSLWSTENELLVWIILGTIAAGAFVLFGL